MIPQQFYYMRGIRDNEDRITIRSNVKRVLPIVWCRGGEYRLVPVEVVQNAINSMTVYTKMAAKATRKPVVCIYWDQGMPITNQAGRILTGDEDVSINSVSGSEGLGDTKA